MDLSSGNIEENDLLLDLPEATISRPKRHAIAEKSPGVLSEEIIKAKGVRKGKKSKVTRLVNQIRQYIKEGINVSSIKALRQELNQAIETMEMSNEVLYILEPENEEHEQWIELALEPTVLCLSDIERYIQQNSSSTRSSCSSRSKSSRSSTSYKYSTSVTTVSAPEVLSNKGQPKACQPEGEAQSSRGKARSATSSHSRSGSLYKDKLLEAKLIEHDIKVISKQNEEDNRMMAEQERKEKQLRETQARIEQETFELRRLNEESMRARKLRTLEENKQRAILEAELLQGMEQGQQEPPPVSTSSVSLLSSKDHPTTNDAPSAKETYTTSVQVQLTGTTKGGSAQHEPSIVYTQNSSTPQVTSSHSALFFTPTPVSTSQGSLLSSQTPINTLDTHARETYTTSVQVQSRETTKGGLLQPQSSIVYTQNSSTPLVTSAHPLLLSTPPFVPSSAHQNSFCRDSAEGIPSIPTPSLMPPSIQINSPWRGQWSKPEQRFSSIPNTSKVTPELPELWGQVPTFMGPPQDQWIDELDESNPYQNQGLHHRVAYGASAFERSLPKFELHKFDGSAMAWPDWISRFKSVVHDQPFLNDHQRMAYLQSLVTSVAKTEIQYLGEDGMNYAVGLRILKSRFADAGKIVRAAISQLKEAPSPRVSDHQGIVKLYQTLRSAVVILHRQRFIADLLSETNVAMVVEKLPDALATKWAMEVQRHELHGRPNLFDLDRWLSEQVRCRQQLVQGEPATKTTSNPKLHVTRKDHGVKASTLATSLNHKVEAKPKENSRSCRCCGQPHALYRCDDFLKRSVSSRREVVNKGTLCFNCLRTGHKAKDCTSKNRCKVENCNGLHHSLLHESKKTESSTYTTSSPTQQVRVPGTPSNIQPSSAPASAEVHSGAANTRVTSSTVPKKTVYFQIVPVRIEGVRGAGPVDTYAILDAGSSDSLLRQDVADALRLEGPEHRLTLGNVESEGAQRISRLLSLKVTPTGNGALNKTVNIERAWTVPRLNIPPRQLVAERDKQKWSHLHDLDVPAVSTSQVGLLIGVDVQEAMLQHEYRRGPKGQPYAVRTDFGWAVAGADHGTAVDASDKPIHVGHVDVTIDEQLNQQLERWWKTESFDTKYDRQELRSQEDEKALQHMQENTKFRKDLGHYETGLLWKAAKPRLPNNLELAKRRLAQLERSLDKDPNKATLYYKTMGSYIDRGYAKKLTQEEANVQPENTWYLPHHAVTNVNKPGKIRVVFNAAAEHKGISLNKELLSGPDLLNSLVGVIMRFRLHAYAFTADIESMFFQVRVIERDQPSLRFLWRGENRDRPPDAYQMLALIFGAKCSPCCANYCLQAAATDSREGYDASTVNTVLNDFYMDDVLKSVKTEDEATHLTQQLIELLSHHGFRLTKFLSNSRKVLANLPSQDVAGSISNLDLDKLPVERALGVLWNTERDTLEVKVSQKSLPPTKRNILKQISTVFDPIGLAAPFILRAKIIMQQLWRQSYSWDQPISGSILQAWESWNEDLSKLADFNIPRCYADAKKEVAGVQLHVCADASEDAFGAVAYLRHEYTDHTFSCSFVFSKARLAPVKPLTIPRLELQAAVLAVRIGQMLSKELNLPKEQITYWTDSATVLQYINNMKARFHTFVSNRIAEIREASSPQQLEAHPRQIESS